MRQTLTLPLVAICLLVGTADLFVVEAFSVPSQSTQKLAAHRSQSSYPLFQLNAHKAENHGKNGSSLFQLISRGRAVSPKRSPVRGSRRLGKMRRSVGVLCTAMAFWFGAAGLRTPPSHASTAVAPALESKSFLSSSLDQIVDRYTKDHMFDDDVYEPVESAYREAIGDKIKGSHPRALSEISSSVLGQDGVKADKESSATGIGGVLLNGVNFLKSRGLSESMAIIVLTGSFVVAGPLAFIFAGMMYATGSKRSINKEFKKRYGATYT
jgi:hypothetical protein